MKEGKPFATHHAYGGLQVHHAADRYGGPVSLTGSPHFTGAPLSPLLDKNKRRNTNMGLSSA